MRVGLVVVALAIVAMIALAPRMAPPDLDGVLDFPFYTSTAALEDASDTIVRGTLSSWTTAPRTIGVTATAKGSPPGTFTYDDRAGSPTSALVVGDEYVVLLADGALVNSAQGFYAVQDGTAVPDADEHRAALVGHPRARSGCACSHTGPDRDLAPRTPCSREFDLAARRLLARLAGPSMDSGDGMHGGGPAAHRRRAPLGARPRTAGRSGGAPTVLDPGATHPGRVGRLGSRRRLAAPDPPPFTTIAWRINHVAEGLAGRADHTGGTHARTERRPPPGRAPPTGRDRRACGRRPTLGGRCCPG